MKSTATLPQAPLAIAVIGLGSLFPRAADVKAYWRVLKRAEDAITPVPDTHWSVDDYFHENPKQPDHTYCRKGGFLSPLSYDPAEFGIPPKLLEATDTSQLLGLLVAKRALANAGYDDDREFDRDRVNVVLGATGTQELVVPLGARLGHPVWRDALRAAGVDPDTARDVMQRIADSYVAWQENSFPGLLGNVIAGRISNRLNLGGTNCTVDAACASSISALNLALLELETGRCDMAVTGGVDTLNDIFMHMCFSQTGVLSHSSNVRPFSQEADGTVLGEGIGIMVLKRLADAEKDGDRIYALIKGVGTSSDGRSQSIYAPNADGQAKALRMAYRMAAIEPRSVDLIETHGTGTRVGDAVEFAALNTVFAESPREQARCAFGSVKSNIGHTKAAAGAAGMIKSILALYHKALPATLVNTPDPKLQIEDSPFFLNDRTRPWITDADRPRRAGVSAFGFGGSNFHVVMEEYRHRKDHVSWDGSVDIVALSSPLKAEMRDRIDRFHRDLVAAKDFTDVARLAAATRASFSVKDAYRLLAVIERPADAAGEDLDAIRDRFLGAASAVENDDAKALEEAALFYGRDQEAGRLAFLFPGQGSQYVGMGNDLAVSFPHGHAYLETANQCFRDVHGLSGSPLTDMIFDVPAAGHPERTSDEMLTSTEAAQPAIGAISAMMLDIVRHFGVDATVMAGHSFGELTALCAAGRLSADDFLSAAVTRGRLMAGDGNDRGAMLAVKAPLADVERLIRDHGLDVVLANRNSPNQGVLSGAAAAIEHARTVCRENKLRAVPLPVSAAFHSELVADAARPFQEFLTGIEFAQTEHTVFANTTAQPYPEDAGEARGVLGDQLLNPVNFVDQIEAMYQAGVRTFLEIGPKAALTGLVKQILKDRPFAAIALDPSSGKASGLSDLAQALCRLAALGHPVDFRRWEDPPRPRPKQMMSVTLTGANYRPPDTPRPPATVSARETVPASPPVEPRANGPLTAGVAVPASSTAQPAPSMPKPPAVERPVHAPAEPPPQDARLTMDALKLVSESLKSMQALQAQTAETHKRFLDAQTEATRHLQQMMERTRHLTETAFAAYPDARPAAPESRPQPTVTAPIPAAETAAVAPVPAPAAPSAPNRSRRDLIETTLMNVVSALTGYPAEMLTGDMDIEADLGIDSIKRVEILSALEEHLPDLPSVSPDVMGTLKTLAAVVDHLSAAPAAADTPPPAAGSGLETILFDVVSELTGYPAEMLSRDMDIEADLGIDSIKRVEILSAIEERLPSLPPVAADVMGSLKTLGAVIDHLNASAPRKPQPPATEATPKSDSPTAADMEALLFAVVSQLTGYPTDMLSRDMDIEADLGIDSIKRVEILSAVEEKLPSLPPVSPDTIGSLRTLGAVIDHLIATPPAPAAPAAAPSPSAAPDAPIQDTLFAIVSDLTGYPTDMLAPEMDIEADLGIDSIKRVEILSAVEERMPHLPAVEPDAMTSLKTLGQIVAYLSVLTRTESAAPADPVAALDVSYTFPSRDDEPEPSFDQRTGRRAVVLVEQSIDTRRPVALPAGRVVYVSDDATGLGRAVVSTLTDRNITAALISGETWRQPDASADAISDAGGLILIPDVDPLTDRFDTTSVWNDADEVYLKTAFQHVRAAAPQLIASAESGGAVLAAVTRLDGGFGFKGRGVLHPLHGGLAGLVKTAAIEWPGVRCCAVDVDPEWTSNDDIAAAIADEVLNDGAIEVALARNGRRVPELREAAPPRGRINLDPGDVVVVTGGAKGVTAACAYALARQARPTLVMLGRSPAPFSEPEWLSPRHTESEMKKAILANEFAGRKPTPRELEDVYRRFASNREIAANLDRLKTAGATVAYYPADVRDVAALDRLFTRIRSEYGPIKGIIHGAGVLADRTIVDKTPAQFERVFDTKAKGLKALLEATRSDPLNYLVLFSSVAGRMGNKGQVDYAMANEVVNKLAQHEAAGRRNCRVISINWGPWDGGMVTPALRKEFHRQGIDLIPLDAGAMSMVYEMMGPVGEPVEVVIGAGLGTDADGGAPNAGVEEPRIAANEPPPALPFTQDVDLATYPILKSHVLGGKPVVPFALMAEWVGHAARQLHPALVFHGIDDMRVLAGIKLENGRKRVTVAAGDPSTEDRLMRLPMTLRNGSGGNGSTVHARAVAVLTDEDIASPEYAPPERISARTYPLSAAEAYDRILFHGDQLQGINAIHGFSDKGIVASLAVAPGPSTWLASPYTDAWVADPMVLDTAFQLAVLWTYEQTGMVSLPSYLATYRQYRRCFPDGNVTAVLEVDAVSDHKLTGDFTFMDADDKVVAQLKGYEAVIDESLMKAFKPEKP